jgi:hypothetical protein
MSSGETVVLLKGSKNPYMLFAAMEHLAGGLSLSALLMVKVKYSPICPVGTWISTVFPERLYNS